MNLFLITAVAIIVVAILWAISAYNRLVQSKNEIANAFGQIDVQLKRRYDLIPNLVEIAKKYLTHERETLEAVIAARNGASSAADALRQTPNKASAITALTQAESVLGKQMGSFTVLNERYPELKADQTLQSLNEELTSTENRVGFARQAYNDSILAYNNDAAQFPNVIVANVFGFAQLPMLQSIESDQERKAIKVSM
jgi:LemA protein